jgi:hypothetical protein
MDIPGMGPEKRKPHFSSQRLGVIFNRRTALRPLGMVDEHGSWHPGDLVDRLATRDYRRGGRKA